jgi:hypothetical protein
MAGVQIMQEQLSAASRATLLQPPKTTEPKKKAGPKGPAFLLSNRYCSDRDDVIRLRAFLALRHSELDLLAFLQGLASLANDRVVVSEHVGTRFLLDEAEAFGIVEPFNGAGNSRHHFILSNQK